MKFSRTFWLHFLAWAAMLVYFFFAPDFFALAFMKNGRPLQTDVILPAESHQIIFAIDGLEPYIKDGEKLYRIYGWALIMPGGTLSEASLERHVTLVSDDRRYVFPTEPEYRNPSLPSTVTATDVDLNHLGFSLLIAEDLIKSGKYRIGIIFQDVSKKAAFYSDKPIHYLIKTPNTLRLEQK